MKHTPATASNQLPEAENLERITAIPFDARARVTMNGKATRWEEMIDADFVLDEGGGDLAIMRPRSFTEVVPGKRYEVRGMVGVTQRDDDGFKAHGPIGVSMRFNRTIVVEYPEDISAKVTRSVEKKVNPFADDDSAEAPADLRQNEPYATPYVKAMTTNQRRNFREVIRSLLGI